MKKISTLIALVIGINFTIAQTIPCPGFETWVNSTESGANYLIPQGWITTDQVQNAFNSSYTGVSSVRTISAYAGSYAALMQTAINNGDTMNGILITCSSVGQFFSAVFGGGNAMGFPYAIRSANLQGYYKFTGVGGDSALAGIVMTKWNTTLQQRDTISYKEYAFTNNASSYTFFNIPLTYTLNYFPDTCAIIIGIDGPNGQKSHVGTVFYVDNLAFVGTVPVGVKEYAGESELVKIFPNPSSGKITLALNNTMHLEGTQVVFYDVLGKQVLSTSSFSSYTKEIDLSLLKKGVYLYQLINNNTIIGGGKLTLTD